MRLWERVKFLAKLLYVGTALSRLHFQSYLVSVVSSILWFLVVFVPTSVFSPNPVAALRIFVPGIFAFGAASVGSWVATEFTRWYVYQGLTDFFRECGLGVEHYLLCGIHIDATSLNLAVFLASFSIASIYVAGSISVAVPSNPLLLAAAVASATAPYMLCGALTAYLYCKTRISGSLTILVQLVYSLGTIVPPTALPNPWIAFANPATVVAELARAAYGANTVPLQQLAIVSPVAVATELILAHVVSKACDKEIAMHGLEFRI